MGEFPDAAIDTSSAFESSSESWPTSASSSSVKATGVSSQLPIAISDTDEPPETPVPTPTSARPQTSHMPESPTSATSASPTSAPIATSFAVQSTSSQVQPSTSVIAPPTTQAPIALPISTHATSTTTRSSVSFASTITRPIVTPSPTSTYSPVTPQQVADHSRLSFAGIVGIVLAAFVALGLIGLCVVIGPRRILRCGKRDKRSIDSWGYEAKAQNDWYNLAPGMASQASSLSVSGPGMAGVGAGGRTVAPKVEQEAPSPRRTVRSGWFSASMGRGASLLSLGSMLKPEPAVPTERQGSAGRRFQELYRREREAGEMGERVPYPAVRRPSRLGTVPAIVIHDATLPSLSSVSHVTGRGYDADIERV